MFTGEVVTDFVVDLDLRLRGVYAGMSSRERWTDSPRWGRGMVL